MDGTPGDAQGRVWIGGEFQKHLWGLRQGGLEPGSSPMECLLGKRRRGFAFELERKEGMTSEGVSFSHLARNETDFA